MNIRDFFKAAGFRPEDTIVHSTKEADGSNYRPVPRMVQEYIALFDDNMISGKNHYYSHATHNGSRNENETASVKEDNFSEIVCMVIDIDYGPHHKNADCKTLKDAMEAIRILTRPTVVIHTGGGLQLVYRFRSRISGHEGRMRYKSLAQVMAAQVHADACQAIGHVFRTPFTQNHKNGAPVRDVEILEMNQDVDYTLTELEEYCRNHNFKLPSSGQQKHKSIAVKKAKQKKLKTGPDNSAEFFKSLDDVLNLYPNLEERKLLALAKKQPFYAHFEEKGDKAEQYCRQDIRRIKQKLTREKRPKPFTKVKPLKYDGESSSELVLAKREIFNSIYDTSGNERITMALALMEKLYLEQKKAILNFPCASGKTTAAMILASAYASPENRFWIVTQKIEDVKKIAEYLRQTGANAKEWHGRPMDCPIERRRFIAEKKGFFCRRCETECTAKGKYLSRDIWDCTSADIVVTTHSHWAAAIIQKKIPASVKYVIVDESPALMEYLVLDQSIINSMSRVFEKKKALQKQFSTDIEFIRNTLEQGGCKKIPVPTILNHMEEIQKCLHKLLSIEVVSPETFEQVQIFLNFFSGKEIYGMLEWQNRNWRMTFIRGTVDLETDIPHIVLDGSALMNDVTWKGFNIYNCKALRRMYPNTTIEVINGNPSKAFLTDADNFAKISEAIVNSVETGSNLLLFRNKDLENDVCLRGNIEVLKTHLQDMGPINLIEMNRGEHIGSNKGRLAEINAVCMSLFNNLSYYVLRTALVYKHEVPASDIWKTLFSRPAMKVNGGFANDEIQQTYCRAIVLDLYQTIMRGCIRDNPANRYKVICAISGLDILTVLKEELPGATFHYENEEVVEALLAGRAKSEIIGLMNPDLNESSRYEMLANIERAVGL